MPFIATITRCLRQSRTFQPCLDSRGRPPVLPIAGERNKLCYIDSGAHRRSSGLFSSCETQRVPPDSEVDFTIVCMILEFGGVRQNSCSQRSQWQTISVHFHPALMGVFSTRQERRSKKGDSQHAHSLSRRTLGPSKVRAPIHA